MSVFSYGTWAGGATHIIIDDVPRTPDARTVMNWFLGLSEEQLIIQLAAETENGTLTQNQANGILTKYYREQTINAYEEESNETTT